MQYITFWIMASFVVLTTACNPDDITDSTTLTLEADFSTEFLDENTVRFINTTLANTTNPIWDLGTLGQATGNEIDVFFPEMGEYAITMKVTGARYSGEVTKTINISQNAAPICEGAVEFITDCSSKTWKLNPEEGALWVGSTDGNTTFWQSSNADVVERFCDWNDEYIFSFDGVYQYVSNNDLWGESYAGFNADACYPIEDLSGNLATWGDGSHRFEVIAGTSQQLKVSGDGAFIGLRKAANGAEVSTPQSEVTYNIIDMRSVNGKDILELEINYGGGIWRFTLYSF